MVTETKQILDKLSDIKSELNYIKEHMVDVDTILTEGEKVALEKARKEYENGKTISLKDLEKELGLKESS